MSYHHEMPVVALSSHKNTRRCESRGRRRHSQGLKLVLAARPGL